MGMEMLGGGKDVAKQCRLPDIMSDAAYVMLTRDGRNFTGNFSLDEAILREEGMTNFDQYAAVPGTKYEDFIPDFFLDAFDDFNEAQKNVVEAQAAPDGSVQSVFDKMSKLINDEMVGKMKAVYAFDISGSDAGKWYVDLKNGSGACGTGAAPSEPDVTFVMRDNNFQKMFAGKLKPTTAFMTGKMKIQGDMGKAMKLEKLMGKMQQRGYHSMPNHQRAYEQMFNRLPLRGFHTSSQLWRDYNSVQEVLGRIKAVASEAIVKQVGAIYLFDVKEQGKYYIDFKISMNEAVFLQIFNRELAPATAFMTGKVKVSGDLSKALTLEKVMKATREAAEANKNKQG